MRTVARIKTLNMFCATFAVAVTAGTAAAAPTSIGPLKRVDAASDVRLVAASSP